MLHTTFSIPIILVPNARLALVRAASAFYGLDELLHTRRLSLAAVTGTNGKTTTTYLIQAFFQESGKGCGRIGTVEYDTGKRRIEAGNTTPGPLELAELLREMADHGLSACAMEASSHALDQKRLDHLAPHVGIFTNLTGDHLDYHKTMPAYREAKARLFDLLAPGGTALINSDDPQADFYLARAKSRGDVQTWTFGLNDCAAIRAEVLRMDAAGTFISLSTPHGKGALQIPLVGRHNVSNVLGAVGAALALGLPFDAVAGALARLPQVPGRLQRVIAGNPEISVFVDYAHTDDALMNVLTALKPLVKPGSRLICVFGCGGDRDRTKRPRMARVAETFADRIHVTSDNPRTEEPQAILAEIVAGFSSPGRAKANVEADRRAAIRQAIRGAGPGDCVLIAGKGHENYQIIGPTKHHFDDVEEARAALTERHA